MSKILVAVVVVVAFTLIFDILYTGTIISQTSALQRYINSDSERLKDAESLITVDSVQFIASSVTRTTVATTTVPETTYVTTTPSPYFIGGMDRFDWYRNKTAGKILKNATRISLMYAYEFVHEITVTITSLNLNGNRVFCRYVAHNGTEIGKPEASFTYPEYIVNCKKREGTKRIGLSVKEKGDFESLPLIDRMMKEPTYELSMCVSTLYGPEPKWLLLIEMIEHYKLQGVEHFYLYIHKVSSYDLKVINDYVRTGELEVHYFLERDQRTDDSWHVVNTADCLIWSRSESKWAIFADLDERLLMTNYSGRIVDYLREIKDEKVGGIQFRQQWILKTELMPAKYEGDKQVEEWMPTHRFHNSSGIGSRGHTAKCIIDSSKVFIMWTHFVTEFYPGHDYFLKQLEPEEGLVRHYRDQSLGNWGQKWLNSTLKFGPLRSTNYPSKYLGQLTKNVKRRANYVYGNKYD